MSSEPTTINESLLKESRKKQQRISGSFLPRARLLAEILYQQVDRDRVFTQAAALTYKTLFSLLPIFVLSLLILSTISLGEGGKNTLGASVKQMFFQQLNVDKLRITDENGQSTNLEAFADRIIDNAQHAINGKATGLIAFAVLVYGALTLMAVIEGTFNQLYGSVKPRSWPRRIMLYWCVLTLGPIGVAASIALGRSAYTTASTHVGAAWLLSTANILTGFLVSWLMILLMYRIIPDTRVNWRPALVGAFLAALAWEVGKWGFGLYVQTTAKNSVYGSLALLPLFMFWIYISWCVALLGIKVAYIQQFWPMLKRHFFFTRAGRGSGITDLRWVLTLGILMNNRFKLGKATHIEQAAEILMLPNDITGELMLALEKAGLVHCTTRGEYSLARPAEKITADDLLNAARGMCRVPPDLSKDAPHVQTSPNSPALAELDQLETTWAKAHTLADLS